MNFFNYPFEIWIATIVAVLVKLRAETKLTLFGVATITLIGIGSGVIFYAPLTAAFGLSIAWQVPMACLITLTADNVMRVFLELSADRKWLGDIIRFWAIRKIDEGKNNDKS